VQRRGGNHTNEVPIAANIDQTEAETAVLIKRQMVMFLVCRGWGVEYIDLPNHVNYATGTDMLILHGQQATTAKPLERASRPEFALPGGGGAQHRRVVTSPSDQHHADRQTI
jgi:hypothetical protein